MITHEEVRKFLSNFDYWLNESTSDLVCKFFNNYITQQEKKEKLLELYKKLNSLYEELYTMELSTLSLNSNYYEIEIIKLKQQIKELEK